MAIFQKIAASSFAAVKKTLHRRLLMLTLHEVVLRDRDLDVEGKHQLLNEARDLISLEYGLGKDPNKMTLEAIGNQYGITRERVRQIENAALASVRKSDTFLSEQETFDELSSAIDSLGGIVAEDELLELISKDKCTQNHILLVLYWTRFSVEKILGGIYGTNNFNHLYILRAKPFRGIKLSNPAQIDMLSFDFVL